MNDEDWEEEGEFVALPSGTIHSFDEAGDPIYYEWVPKGAFEGSDWA
jgi:quercetin dioxygenase-like cupin family protein